MPNFRAALTTLLVSGSLLLAGCAGAPPEEAPPVDRITPPESDELNIPEPAAVGECNCETPDPARIENHFDRGVRALAARDYARARVYFERHRESGEAQALREADVGIAFVTMLDAANGEGEGETGASGVDERAEVMILALAAIEALESQLAQISEINRALASDLEKREEALKRLRDLTLGQPEG